MDYGYRRGKCASRVVLCLALISLAGIAVSCSNSGPTGSPAIVATDRLRLRSSTAEAARTVGELKGGDRVSILEHADAEGVAWVKIQGADGTTGWVQMRNLIDQEAFDKSHQLADQLKDIQTQAVGRSKATLKLRLTPDRTSDENVLILLPTSTELQILRRERKPRPNLASEGKEGEPASDTKYDEWYQVRVESSQVTPAGWIYGGSIELQIPPDIVYYPSAGRRIVGWQSLGEAKDENGRAGTHFLVLEREIFGKDQDVDFDRVKILAYDPGARDYSTPFREDLAGHFPIKLTLEGRRGSFDIPTGDGSRVVSYQLQVAESGKFEVSRLTPREPASHKKKR